jgi:hypothetical protein
MPGTEYSYRLWRYWMTQEDANFKADLTNNNVRYLILIIKLFKKYLIQ